MNCPHCGGEIPADESLCPLCGENISNHKPESKGKQKRIIAAVLAGIAAFGVIGGVLFMQPKISAPNLNDKDISSIVSYTTKNSVCTLLPGSNQELTLIHNAAKDMNSFATFADIINNSSSYFGTQNFSRIGDELIFQRTTLNSVDESAQTIDVDYELCSVVPGSEISVIDSDAQAVSCVSDESIYYLKGATETVYQYRYNKEDGITRIDDIVYADFVRVTHCSSDDSMLGFVAADIDDDNHIVMKNGYIHNGSVHFFPEEDADSEVYFISPDGEHVYVIDITDPNGRAVTVKYLSDKESGQLTTIAENSTEFIFYEDSGSMSCIADVTLSDTVLNPVGQLLYFDADSKSTTIIAEDAVALVESNAKSYYWLNENSREMVITEQSGLSSVPSETLKGSFHYINADGTLCAADSNSISFPLAQGFYDPESYACSSDLMFLTEKDGAFYWAQGDKVYRYTIGSMTAPDTVTLDGNLNDKLSSGLEIGYVLTNDGAVLEQSGNTLNVKPFDQPSYTIYDGPESIIVVGLSADGEKIYFVDHDCTLMEKTLSDSSDVVILAENVYDAMVVSNGIYLLTDYNENGGNLQYKGFHDKEFTTLRGGVMSMVETIVQQ